MTSALLLNLAVSDPVSAPVLAAIDKIWIILAIGIGSIIIEWLKKRHPPVEPGSSDEAESHGSTSTTTQPAQPRPAATSDWEEELRRLLGGKPPESKPPPVPTPQRTTVPQPIRPVIIEAPRPVPARPPVTSAPTVARSSPLAGTAMAEAETSIEVQLPTLKESVTAYQRASHLQEQVIERLKHVEEMTERHLARVPTAHRQSVSADAVRSIALIRDRKTVRQAIVAGLILGTPKGLENE